jgi:hypothetical protein
MKKEVEVIIINSKSNYGENCSITLEFENVNKLISIINSIIVEVKYRKSEVEITPSNFNFDIDEIEKLEEEGFVIS